jgi:hypothetical protein
MREHRIGKYLREESILLLSSLKYNCQVKANAKTLPHRVLRYLDIVCKTTINKGEEEKISTLY